ncbi:GntR family transcriptional regulator [Gemmatimonadota bacterium]
MTRAKAKDEQPRSSEPIRARVRQLLLERLLSGQLRPGARVNESKLAQELRVSRTPLREALLWLEFEGLLENEKGKGFSVSLLSPESAKQLYSLTGLLEGVALEETEEFGEAQLDQLARLEEEWREAHQLHRVHEAVELDNDWHSILVSGCKNSDLLQILEVVKQRLFRYESVLADRFPSRSVPLHDHHSLILKALREGNRDLAIEQLKHHWRMSAEIRSEWLKGGGEAIPDRWTSLM